MTVEDGKSMRAGFAAQRHLTEIAARAVEGDAALPLDRRISLSVVDAAGFAAHTEEFLSLSRRAAVANAFMDPAVALAMEPSAGGPMRALLAWHAGTAERPRRFLVGAWLGVVRPTRLTWPFRSLVSPVTSVGYLGTPVIDADFAVSVLTLFVQRLRDDPQLPDFAEIGDFSASLLPALAMALRQADMPWAVVGTQRRARLLPCADPAAFWASSSSKAHISDLARRRRRLQELGRLEMTIDDGAAAVATGLEAFLSLEAAGWKGARGSALLSKPSLAAAVRKMIHGMAARGQVKIHALRLDGRPLAMSVSLYAGRSAFTWRMAYDEGFQRFSPGVQLLERVTFDLLNDPEVLSTDSCNDGDTGFQAERWTERHELVDLLIGVRRASSLVVDLFARRERAVRRAREAARRLRGTTRRLWAKRRRGRAG